MGAPGRQLPDRSHFLLLQHLGLSSFYGTVGLVKFMGGGFELGDQVLSFDGVTNGAFEEGGGQAILEEKILGAFIEGL